MSPRGGSEVVIGCRVWEIGSCIRAEWCSACARQVRRVCIPRLYSRASRCGDISNSLLCVNVEVVFSLENRHLSGTHGEISALESHASRPAAREWVFSWKSVHHVTARMGKILRRIPWEGPSGTHYSKEYSRLNGVLLILD